MNSVAERTTVAEEHIAVVDLAVDKQDRPRSSMSHLSNVAFLSSLLASHFGK
jgi:hypothetical protein